MKMRIRELRKEQGLTLEQLAERAGVSRSHLNEFELARKAPNARRIQNIARALGVGVSELFDDTPEAVRFFMRYNRLAPKDRRLVDDLLDRVDPGDDVAEEESTR